MRPVLYRLVHIVLIGAVAAAAALIDCSCDLVAKRSRAVVALDEAFAASRPGLAAMLQNGRLFGLGPAGLLDRAEVLSVALSDGAGKALDAALEEERRSGAPSVLVTSPLIAKAILAGGTWRGDPPLLVPEWHGAPKDSGTGDSIPGFWSATTDPVPAYAAAGAAAGAFIAALAKGGGSPSCGILFSEAPSRPHIALAAFAAAFAEASDGLSLKVRELREDTDATASSGPPPPGPPPPGPPPPKAPESISAERAAQDAVAELLGSDIRVLFVALGSASGAAITAAARPGVAIGADFPSTDPPASLAFRITPNDRGLAESLAREGRILLSTTNQGGRGGAAGVPSLLVAGPAAATSRATSRDFAYFLSAAARRKPPSRPRKSLRGGRVIRPKAMEPFSTLP